MKKQTVTILGIDPGTATTGWGVITEHNKKPVLKAYGCIETSKLKTDVQRLKEVASDVRSLIRTYQPDEAAIEQLFFFKNVRTAIKVAQARGVLLLTASELHIPLFEYTPLQVKQAVTGYGRADKKQIQQMVKGLLGMESVPKPDDAADALAIAICHLQSRVLMQLGQ